MGSSRPRPAASFKGRYKFESILCSNIILAVAAEALSFSLRFAQGERGAEPVPLPSAPLRENQGHETDRFAAAQPRVSCTNPNLKGKESKDEYRKQVSGNG